MTELLKAQNVKTAEVSDIRQTVILLLLKETEIINSNFHFIYRSNPKTEKTVLKGHGLILIAEDEITIRNVEEKIISECGYDCLLAQNGKEALELYRQKSSEILLVII